MDEIRNFHQPVDRLRLEEVNMILGKYKTGMARLDARVKFAENWRKMRNLKSRALAEGLRDSAESPEGPTAGCVCMNTP